MAAKVYAPHDELVWVAAAVITPANAKGEVEIRINDPDVPQEPGTRIISLPKYSLTELPLQNTDIPNNGIADMCNLPYLHEASILDNLRRRYFSNYPYTYSADICVAINPYQWLDIYTPHLRDSYKVQNRSKLSPHVYATSAASFSGLTENGRNQSILVSGESGAGKTETVKIMMSHITHIAKHSGSNTIEKLLKANPLLESFGNAKTVRNDNSSRFGKFSQLQFTPDSFLVGSKCVTYLLEKTRVASQFQGERNYHIFYQLLAAPPATKRDLQLSGRHLNEFHYTNMGDITTTAIEGRSDGDRFMSTIEALELLDISDAILSQVLHILSGLLFLGNVNLLPKTNDSDASMLDIGTTKLDAAMEFVSPRTCNVVTCVNLLGLNISSFSDAITCRTIDVEGQKLSVPLTIDQAMSGRDALAKEIYARLFQWLVLVINFNTSYRSTSESDAVGTISLLDIFGFESFAVNRFEQLCINYANEKLQQKFTMDVLLSVQSEYEAEGIRWSHIQIVDNSDLLELIEGKKGFIQTLNEECLVPKGSDLTLFSKLKSAFASSPNLYSTNPRFKDQFTVNHYAGKVTYNITGFLERNKDTLPEDMRLLLVGSSNPLLSKLFSETEMFSGQSAEADELLRTKDDSFIRSFLLIDQSENRHESSVFTFRIPEDETPPSSFASGKKTNRRSSFMSALTVTTKFKTQLTKLMETISATQVQYVRCIKPNTNKSATEFNRLLVVEQLRSAGMIAAVKITRAAYPSRLLYKEFYCRFRILRPDFWHQDVILSQQRRQITADTAKLMDHVKCIVGAILPDMYTSIPRLADEFNGETLPENVKYYQFGLTKVFFAAGILEKLEIYRTEAMMELILIAQCFARGRVYRNRYLRQRRACIRIQATVRGHLVRIPFLKMKLRVTRIQSAWRGFIKRMNYQLMRLSQIRIASVARMMSSKKILKALIKERNARLERERKERERKEKERLERERLERERQEKEQQERERKLREQERLAKEKADEIERKRLETSSAVTSPRPDNTLARKPSIGSLQLPNFGAAEGENNSPISRISPRKSISKPPALQSPRGSVSDVRSTDSTDAQFGTDSNASASAGASHPTYSSDSLIFSPNGPTVPVPTVEAQVCLSPLSFSPQGSRTSRSGSKRPPQPSSVPKSDASKTLALVSPSESTPQGIATDESGDTLYVANMENSHNIKVLNQKIIQLEQALIQSRERERKAIEQADQLTRFHRDMEEEFSRTKKSLLVTKDKLVAQIADFDALEIENGNLKREISQLSLEKRMLVADVDSKNSDTIALKHALKQTQLKLSDKNNSEESEKSFFGGIFSKKSGASGNGTASTAVNDHIAELEAELSAAMSKINVLEDLLANEKQQNALLKQFQEDIAKSMGKKAGSSGGGSIVKDALEGQMPRSKSPASDSGSGQDMKELISAVASETAAQVRKEFETQRRYSNSQDNGDSSGIQVTRRKSNPQIAYQTPPPPYGRMHAEGNLNNGNINNIINNINSPDNRRAMRAPPQRSNSGSNLLVAVGGALAPAPPPPPSYSSIPGNQPYANSPMASAFSVTMPTRQPPPPYSSAPTTPGSIASTPKDTDSVSTGMIRRSSYRAKSPSPIIIPDQDTPHSDSSISQSTAQTALGKFSPEQLASKPAIASGGLLVVTGGRSASDIHHGATIGGGAGSHQNSRESSPGRSVASYSSRNADTVVDLSRVAALIDGPSGWHVKLYLMTSRSTDLLVRAAIIRRTPHPNSDAKDEDHFEIELIENENSPHEQNKKMKFGANELRRVKKGKGKLEFAEDDRLCLILIFRGGKVKGELNIVFPTEAERDIAVMYFSMAIPKSPTADDASVDSGMGRNHGPPSHRPHGNTASMLPPPPPNSLQHQSSQQPHHHHHNHQQQLASPYVVPPPMTSSNQQGTPQSRRNISGPPPPMRSASPTNRKLSSTPTSQINGEGRLSRINSKESLASNASGTGPVVVMPLPPSSRQGPSPVNNGPPSRINHRTAPSRTVVAALEPQKLGQTGTQLKLQGWVLREDVLPSGQSNWAKRFMFLDYENAILKFGSSPVVITNQSMVDWSMRLTKDMHCTRPNDSNDDNCLVEIADSKGLRLRIQCTSDEDQLEWLTSINSILD